VNLIRISADLTVSCKIMLNKNNN